jgi:hypothetical protein
LASGEEFSGLEQRGRIEELGDGRVRIVPPLSTSTTEEGGDIMGTRADLIRHLEQILDPTTYTAFLGTPSGRMGLFIPAKDIVFTLSPDSRLLSAGARIPAAAYAH